VRSGAVGLGGQPEDQLKAPVAELLESFASTMGFSGVLTESEARVSGVGRPDLAVGVGRLLCGHVELKAPGRGANPERFDGHDRDQWEKFKALPNLVYTDANDWALFRGGERVATVRLARDVTADGAAAIGSEDADRLSRLLRPFFSWDPIVPTNPRALAEVLAPLCHLLRDDVLQAVEDPNSSLSVLAAGWRYLLFPDASNAEFADAYAQTLTYALLLAQFSGATDLSTASAADTLQANHGLLAQALTVLTHPQAREEIELGVDLLERSIAKVDPGAVAEEADEPWLYFYEDFLTAYDRNLRNARGVYYTPAEVVRCQVRLVSELLVEKLHKDLSFADDGVVVLDPAVGTGTYPLAVLQHGLKFAADFYGETASSATEMARNVHAFEFLVGPYAVAHLRISKEILDAEGTLPEDGTHVYLTSTLESPNAAPPGRLTVFEQRLAQEHQRALEVKKNTKVLVCLGNPPYNRHQGEEVEHSGGWVRRGEGGDETENAIFQAFLKPARRSGAGPHLKNVYNDYVYFWRWALWKVFETQSGPGIVSFITAASYLRGPGFVGMREVMRRSFDELWIIDLEGGNLGARKTQNVFKIQTPVAIAVGVRYSDPQPQKPAQVWYTKIEGTRDEKLAKLETILTFQHLSWEKCFRDWPDIFLPERTGDYFSWPSLTDLFPWQHSLDFSHLAAQQTAWL
jgi:N-6 DNA Methylase